MDRAEAFHETLIFAHVHITDKGDPTVEPSYRLASDVQLMFQRPPRQPYAALCYRLKGKTGALEVLLLTSRDTGRWVIPKGWPMEGKTS